MKGFILVSAILNLGLCYAYPGSQGVGAYAYQDSAGNRYGGTYDLDSVPAESNFITPFNDFQDDFFPAYFKNFQKFIEQNNTQLKYTGETAVPSAEHINTQHTVIVREQFGSNIASQRFPHPKRYYIPTPQRVPFTPFFRLPNYGGFPSVEPIQPIQPLQPIQPIQPLQPKFGMNFGDNFASNSAFAGAAAGPGGVHQVAAIDPPSSNTQNIDVNRAAQPGSNFYGVSSSSFASSSNVNGKVTGTRRAETVVNENGKVTKYKVEE